MDVLYEIYTTGQFTFWDSLLYGFKWYSGPIMFILLVVLTCLGFYKSFGPVIKKRELRFKIRYYFQQLHKDYAPIYFSLFVSCLVASIAITLLQVYTINETMLHAEKLIKENQLSMEENKNTYTLTFSDTVMGMNKNDQNDRYTVKTTSGFEFEVEQIDEFTFEKTLDFVIETSKNMHPISIIKAEDIHHISVNNEEVYRK